MSYQDHKSDVRDEVLAVVKSNDLMMLVDDKNLRQTLTGIDEHKLRPGQFVIVERDRETFRQQAAIIRSIREKHGSAPAHLCGDLFSAIDKFGYRCRVIDADIQKTMLSEEERLIIMRWMKAQPNGYLHLTICTRDREERTFAEREGILSASFEDAGYFPHEVYGYQQDTKKITMASLVYKLEKITRQEMALRPKSAVLIPGTDTYEVTWYLYPDEVTHEDVNSDAVKICKGMDTSP